MVGLEERLAHLIDPNELEAVERDERNCLESTRAIIDKDVNQLVIKLTRLMGDAKKLDTGALAKSWQEWQDIPAYLEGMRALGEEALPEKLNQF